MRRRSIWVGVLGTLALAVGASCDDGGGATADDVSAQGDTSPATDAAPLGDTGAGLDAFTPGDTRPPRDTAGPGEVTPADDTLPAGDTLVEDAGPTQPRTRVAVTLVSHNEDTATGQNPSCVAFRDNIETRWATNRQALLDLAQIVEDRGAAWSFQTDIEFINLMLERETESDNIIRHLADRPAGRISVDAHAHEGPGKNYADVANALERVSGVRNGVVGGFTAIACPPAPQQPVWEKFREPLMPLQGGAPFVATVLTDGASPGHGCDDQGGVSGIWRPKSHEDFFTDDPTQTLPNIGTGVGGHGASVVLDALAALVDDLRAGKLEEGRLYTISWTVPQCDFDVAGSGVTPTDLAAFIDAVNAIDGGTGDIVWATFPQILDLWRTEYGSQPSQWRAEP